MNEILKVLNGREARACMGQGVRLVVKAIAPIFGPHGRTVMAHRPPAPPIALHNGCEVAREIASICRGPLATGARILKETLFDVDRDLGDGTSAVALMIGSILSSGVKLSQSGYAMGEVADALLELARDLKERVQAHRVDFMTEEMTRPVALTAARAPEIANEIASLFLRLGTDAIVQVQEGEGQGIEAEVRAGTTVEATLVSRLLSEEADRIFVQLKQPFVLVVDEEIKDFAALLPILEGFAARKKALLVIARDVRGPALHALIRNKKEAGLRIAALKITNVAERGFEELEDIAIATGAELVSDRFGTRLQNLRPHMLGRAEEVEVRGAFTTVVDGAARGDELERRRKEIRMRLAHERYLSYDREQLERRLARLNGGFARLRIGGLTAAERSLRLTAARRAVAALQAARQGVVPGGGTVPLRLSAGLVSRREPDMVRLAARRLTAQALRTIPATMIGNAGEDPLIWMGRIELCTAPAGGLDLATMALGDLGKAGVLDAAPIVGGTIERALSAAATLLRADILISR